MAAFFPKSAKQYKVRSLSLPARSHPSTLKVEEELVKLISWETSSSSKAENTCSGLSGLGELYRCIGDLFTLSSTQEALAQHQHEKWVNELLDGLLSYLDVCSNTRDAVLLTQQNVRELQSALRRSKCGKYSGIKSNVTAYISSRKTIKKEISKCLASLNQIETKFEASSPLLELNDHLYLVVGMLRKANLITASIFHSLLIFLSVPMLKPKQPTRWSLVMKLVHKRVAIFEGEWEVNELESVDIALSNLLMQQSSCRDVDGVEKNIECAHQRLGALDVRIEGFENELECLFRRLVHARVSLLNILSH